MSLREFGTVVKGFGIGVTWVGLACLFVASVVGTVSIDLVILMALSKSGSRHNGVLTGFILGSFLFRDRSYSYTSPAVLMVSSLIMTAIAIGIAMAYAMPFVAIILAGIWALAIGVTGLGIGIKALGEVIEKENYVTFPAPANTAQFPPSFAPREEMQVLQEPVAGVVLYPPSSNDNTAAAENRPTCSVKV
ncbi:MAG: hypothetical protein A3F18_00170 [Legionellales bacterium RIFCSPHIGHO2_12_FULL_37_14]|nr:MAG: hypothetical protein A3F18_00170 [Legionellales bacterium RIFCSPHIGHO2_12_FULL_37_14]